MLSIGLGQTEGTDTETVAKRVISACISRISGRAPRAGIVFAGINFDHQHMLNLINDAFPDIQLIGCTTAGDFSSAHGFSDDSITLMVIASDEIEIGTGVGRGLSVHYETSLRDAVKTARSKSDRNPSLCLTFPHAYDIRHEPILRELCEALGPNCPIFGGASGTQWTDAIRIRQFYGREVLTDSIPILLMFGPLKHAFCIANSWRPLGRKARVTEATDRFVRKIGGLSAVDYYRHYLGHHEEPAREFILAVYEKGREQFYMRAPVAYNDDGSVTFTEAIPEGAEVQLTEAVRGDLIRDTITTTKRLNKTAHDWKPAFALAFSCAFRKEILGTAAEKELEILKNNFPPDLPIAGFYSFGEIAPLVPGGESLVHGATLVTLLIGPKADRAFRPVETGIKESERTGTESLQHQNTFLKRKLQRSESYRQRLEDMRDFNLAIHRQILNIVFDKLREFCQGRKSDDDITLVIIKIKDPAASCRESSTERISV